MRKGLCKTMRRTDRKKKLIFIDFDNVLIDTRAFGKSWIEAFAAYGILREDARESYDRAKTTRITYDFNRHLEILGEKYPDLNHAALETHLQAARLASHKFVFDDSIDFLERLAHSHFFELVTSGTKEHQYDKIQGSGLMAHFNFVNFVPPGQKKSDAIARRLAVLGPSNFIFIDDIAENIEDVKNSFPSSRTINVLRFNDQVRSGFADICVTNLQELISIINGSK